MGGLSRLQVEPVKYLCRVPRPLGIVQFGHDVITVVATAELLKEN